MTEPNNSPTSWADRIEAWLKRAYYFTWGAGILGAVAAAAAAAAREHPVLRNLLYYLSVVLGLCFFSFVHSTIRSRPHGQREILNPLLELEHCEMDYSIRPDGLTSHEKSTFVTKGSTSVLTFSESLTGTGRLTLELHSSGELRGPVSRKDRDFHQVVFPEALRKGERYVLDITRRVDDPSKSMRPFVSKTYSNCAGYGTLTMRVTFPNEKPHQVLHSVHREVSATLRDPVESLFLSPAGTAVVDVHRIVAGRSYLVSWVW